MNKEAAVKRYRRLFLSEFAEAIVVAIIVAAILRVFFVSIYRVPTESMQPSLIPGDFIVAWKTSYGVTIPFSDGAKWGARSPERGDVVVFRLPGEDSLFVKRVVGLPGDRISIANGKLILNEVTVTGEADSGDGEGSDGLRRAIESTGTSTHVVMRRAEASEADFLAPMVVPPNEVFVLGDFRSESVDSRQWGTVPIASIDGRVARVAFSLVLDAQKSGVDLKAEHGGALKPTGRVRWDRIFHRVD